MSSSTTAQCYYPDGTVDDTLTPCNATAAISACCAPGDSCSTSGLCFGSIGYVYRSGCTDRTWTSTICPSECHTDPIANTAYSGWTNIFPCTAGLQTSDFCCASFTNESCCSSTFQITNTGMAFKPGTDALIANLTSSTTGTPASTPTSSASSTETSASARGTDYGVAIGAGVGIPLGLIGLGLLGFLVWREKNKHKRAADHSHELLLAQKQPQEAPKVAQLHDSSRPPPPFNAVELPNPTYDRYEMRA